MSSIQDKTIRPGSLKGYSYYYGARRPLAAAKSARPAKEGRKGFLLIAALVVVSGIWLGFKGADGKPPVSSQNPSVTATAADEKTSPDQLARAPETNHCKGNTADKLIKISIESRHLWACEHEKQVQSYPVITGLRHHPETETPLGTYQIYAKQTDTRLTGTDSRGDWNYAVYYWMPFLDNQYGTYGFHDATWRPNSEFGNISPDSDKASHGCIELLLADSKWLYEWSPVGTTVQIDA